MKERKNDTSSSNYIALQCCKRRMKVLIYMSISSICLQLLKKVKDIQLQFIVNFYRNVNVYITNRKHEMKFKKSLEFNIEPFKVICINVIHFLQSKTSKIVSCVLISLFFSFWPVIRSI